jgi:hypothetical protein
MRKFAAFALAGALALSSLAGCSQTERATVFGGAVGAGVGAVATHSAGGTVVGAGIGALTGYFLAKNSYRCQKRNIFGDLYWGWCLKK